MGSSDGVTPHDDVTGEEIDPLLQSSLEVTREAFRAVFGSFEGPLNAAQLIRIGRDDYEDWLAWDPRDSSK